MPATTIVKPNLIKELKNIKNSAKKVKEGLEELAIYQNMVTSGALQLVAGNTIADVSDSDAQVLGLIDGGKVVIEFGNLLSEANGLLQGNNSPIYTYTLSVASPKG